MARGERRSIVEAALNGGRTRAEQPVVPYRPAEVATEARACAHAGASVVHIHARAMDGGWSAEVSWYVEALRRIRDAAPDLLVSITSIRPAGVPVSAQLDLLAALSAAPATRPDLMSVNLGHIATWERAPGGGRRTAHYPNDYEDVVRLLDACRQLGITPEFGLMDIGFLSNAVALDRDGLLGDWGWFLLELDSPAFGDGAQVAPSTTENYPFLARLLRQRFPNAVWAAHGNGLATYEIVAAAIEEGTHVRVGFEDCVSLPDGRLTPGNAALVDWAVGRVLAAGLEPATPARRGRSSRRRAQGDSGSAGPPAHLPTGTIERPGGAPGAHRCRPAGRVSRPGRGGPPPPLRGG